MQLIEKDHNSKDKILIIHPKSGTENCVNLGTKPCQSWKKIDVTLHTIGPHLNRCDLISDDDFSPRFTRFHVRD